MNILGLIPARGGSKGLPKKNILPIAGKPLIAWTIEVAKQSKLISRVVVTTDDTEIAAISKEWGAEVPFLRPKRLAKDITPSFDVINHALNWFQKRKEVFDLFVLLEPTSPLRDSKDIEDAIEKLLGTPEAKSIVGIAKTESTHPAFLSTVQKGLLKPAFSSFSVLRRQDLDDYFYFEGSLYISYVDYLLKVKTFYHDKTLGYIMPKWKSYEIDELSDLIIIESLLKAKQKGILK